ncbi:MAG: SPFH domain-containing protein [Bacteroidales bacterium]|nr:SPFH domain-containing protein [Bacteroidales bacterium]
MDKDISKSSHEHPYSGFCIPGFGALATAIIMFVCAVGLFTYDEILPLSGGALLIICAVMLLVGVTKLEPNESYVMLFFGKYKGTLRRTGFFWINPFMTKRKMSLRINNIDIQPIKVNDRTGNPVMIGMVLVWKVNDTYRASFDVDAGSGNRFNALRNFVATQGDAALREVAGHFAYDDEEHGSQLTLRSGGDEINRLLEHKINERLDIAGLTVVEARINYLAYAPEIAAVMLRRQQASAIIAAREKIVEGAVSMVHMALSNLEEQNVVKLDNDKRADIVGNLLMVLCSDESARPVIPTD